MFALFLDLLKKFIQVLVLNIVILTALPICSVPKILVLYFLKMRTYITMAVTLNAEYWYSFCND